MFHAGGGENIDDKVRLEIMSAETEKNPVRWLSNGWSHGVKFLIVGDVTQ